MPEADEAVAPSSDVEDWHTPAIGSTDDAESLLQANVKEPLVEEVFQNGIDLQDDEPKESEDNAELANLEGREGVIEPLGVSAPATYADATNVSDTPITYAHEQLTVCILRTHLNSLPANSRTSRKKFSLCLSLPTIPVCRPLLLRKRRSLMQPTQSTQIRNPSKPSLGRRPFTSSMKGRCTHLRHRTGLWHPRNRSRRSEQMAKSEAVAAADSVPGEPTRPGGQPIELHRLQGLWILEQ